MNCIAHANGRVGRARSEPTSLDLTMTWCGSLLDPPTDARELPESEVRSENVAGCLDRRYPGCRGSARATDNTPPPGFVALFNGKDLSGWKGLLKPPLDNPALRAKLTPEQRAAAQKEADEVMRAGWHVADGVLTFNGQGRNLCTAKDYDDFEMYVDWKIQSHGDSGVYLRGSPQVQIWDYIQWKIGSGGLYNNVMHPATP